MPAALTPVLDFMLITAAPDIAVFAQACGVASIFVDMETRGKHERQGHLDTHKSAHTLADVAAIAEAVASAEVMFRLNPPWEGTKEEIEAAIAAGARRLMLPMFTSASEVRSFLAAVAGRVPVTFLVEAPQALVRLPAYLAELGPEDRIHFGLNDLALGCGLRFLFEPLAGRLLDEPARLCGTAGIAFGIGGVGRIGHGELPAEWIIGEHVRLGSSWVILSRAFRGNATTREELDVQFDLATELAALRQVEDEFRTAADSLLEENHRRLADRVFSLVGEQP